MSDFRKPRPDYPIYPSTGYFRQRAKVFKRPKGRRGRKPKGKRVGSFVPYQDPNFLIIKAQDEARKARELAVEQVKQQREQLRLQGEAQQETQRYRAKKLELLQQQTTQGTPKEREQLRKEEEPERREGERQEVILLSDKEREDRRRRERSVSIDETPVFAELEPEPEPQIEIPEEEGFGQGHRTRGEEQRRKPKRFEGGATEEELAAAGAIEGQTPRGATGSEETQRRGKGAGGKVPKVFVKDVGVGQRDIKDVKITKKTTTTFQDTPQAFEQEGDERVKDVKITKKTTFYPTAEN